MKPVTQTLMIILAIAFAIALSLTVALLCLSYAQALPHGSSTPESDPPPSFPFPESDTSPESALPPPTTGDTGAEATEEPTIGIIPEAAYRAARRVAVSFADASRL